MDSIKKVKTNFYNIEETLQKLTSKIEQINTVNNDIETLALEIEPNNTTYNFEEIISVMQNATESDGNAYNDLAGSEYKTFEEFVQHITFNITKAGYATPNAVVTAAISFLSDYTKSSGRLIKYSYNHRGEGEQEPDKDGLQNPENLCIDCSGFVGWCLYNAGFKIPVDYCNTYEIKKWAENSGIDRDSHDSSGNPGDLLVKNNGSYGHIMLIVGKENDGYIIAESSGIDGEDIAYSDRPDGGIIRKISFESNELDPYIRVDMRDYYNNPDNKRTK